MNKAIQPEPVARPVERKQVQARAKALGLPATGTTAEISRLVEVVQSHPRTWTKADFDAIKHHLSVHQDFRSSPEQREESILAAGLHSGMVDSLGSIDDKMSWTWAKELTQKRAYVFVSGALSYKGGSPWLAPGNVPLFALTPHPGRTVFEVIQATARIPGERITQPDDGSDLIELAISEPVENQTDSERPRMRG